MLCGKVSGLLPANQVTFRSPATSAFYNLSEHQARGKLLKTHSLALILQRPAEWALQMAPGMGPQPMSCRDRVEPFVYNGVSCVPVHTHTLMPWHFVRSMNSFPSASNFSSLLLGSPFIAALSHTGRFPKEQVCYLWGFFSIIMNH
jgi:hypothetical protein